MKNLLKVVELITEKYLKNIELIVTENKLILEYLTYASGEKDIFKTVHIEEFDDKLKLTWIPEKIVRLIDIQEISEIILILEKQCNSKKFCREEIEYIKEKYVTGTKIQLIKMYDYESNVPIGTRGIVKAVDDMGNIQVLWENKSTLSLVVGVDEFKIC